jgi:hypothetical protein
MESHLLNVFEWLVLKNLPEDIMVRLSLKEVAFL